MINARTRETHTHTLTLVIKIVNVAWVSRVQKLAGENLEKSKQWKPFVSLKLPWASLEVLDPWEPFVQSPLPTEMELEKGSETEPNSLSTLTFKVSFWSFL